MADAQPNSDGLAVDPPGKVKKNAAKGARKPRSECTPEEIAKLDADSAKRRNRRAAVKSKTSAAKFAAERDAMEAARRKAEVEEKEAIVNKAYALLMLGICRPTGFSAAAVGPESTGSSVARPPHCQSPTSRTTPMSPGFPPPRHDGQTHFSGSPNVGVIAPSTPRPSAVIDLNVTPGSSSGGRPSVEMQRKQARPPFTGTKPSPRVLFDGMPKRGKKTAALAGGGDGEALKRLRGKTNSKVDDIRDASSMALHETLHGMMSQKDVRDEKKRQRKDEQMKQCLELQRKKLEMEETAKKRKIDMEEASRQRQLDIEAANFTARQRQLDIEATNAATKAKEVALAIMSVDLTKISEKTRSWFEARRRRCSTPTA
ncbi:hypothetical protein VPH35_061577 [Triticum aestivum]